jgi:hypothetical protein
MKVCLVGAPFVTDFDNREFAESVRLVAHQAPLGVLTLASLAREVGIDVSVVDLDAIYYEFLSAPKRERSLGHAGFAARRLLAVECDLVGFGTLCSSYPATLRIAEQVKRLAPDRAIVFGGPQASVVDRETLKAFDFVDFVLRGEADRSFLEFLEALGSPRSSLEKVPGLAFRDGARIVQTPAPPLVEDLDSLPLPAFDLYPQIRRGGHLPLELGRGCPYACTFCATNDFFRRRFRLKSPQKMLEQMQLLRDAYGTNSFSLVHDMFTVDRRRVIAFCDALLGSGDGFQWSCSARTDRVDRELMQLMFEAGCRGIFFGIETGSPTLQKSIKKKLDLEHAAEQIRLADAIGIEIEVSLITGFAEETRADVGDTVAFFMDSMRLKHTDGNIGLLAPLVGTPIEVEHRGALVLDAFHSDVSFQGWQQDAADCELIRAHPTIFSNFFAVPTRHVERRYLHEVREFAVHGVEWFRKLLVALHLDSGALLDVIDEWFEWRTREGDQQAPEGQEHMPYYIRAQFHSEFLRFVDEWYLPKRARAKEVVRALVDYERTFNAPDREGVSANELPRRRPGFQPGDAPEVAQGVLMLSFPVRYDWLDAALHSGSKLTELEPHPCLLVAAPTLSETPKVRQLSPVLGDLLLSCNGRATVESIAEGLRQRIPGDVPVLKACQFGLFTLWRLGMIVESDFAAAA